MIHVVASVRLRPGTKEQHLRELSAVLPTIRAEPGCIEYAVLEDMSLGLKSEAAIRPEVVTILEKWADAAALEAHLGAPHMTEYRKRVASFVDSVELRILQRPPLAG